MRTWTVAFWILPAVALGLSGCSKAKSGSDLSARPALRSVLEAEEEPAAESPLRVDPPGYVLGAIPIHGGNVESAFQVRNESTAPITLTRVTSSCGCTTAVLEFADGSEAGPFGMAGHQLPTQIQRTVAPSEEFRVRAIFDPAAHGLDGLGKVTRAIFLELEDGSVARLVFTGEVVVE